MVEKQPKTTVPKTSPDNKHKLDNPEVNAGDSTPKPAAVDRAGFDLGGSTGKTSAGTGLGLGPDAAENRRDRSPPGRRGKRP